MLEGLRKQLGIGISEKSFHRYIAIKFLRKAEEVNSKTIRREQAMRIFWLQKIPKNCRKQFLQEMQEQGFIRIKDKQNIEVLEK